MKSYKTDEAMTLLTRKERKEVEVLSHNADMEFARNDFDGGMIHSFFYDCVAGGILRARTKPKNYVNTFYDFYIDMRCGRGYYSTQKAIIEILRKIELIVDKTKKPCSLCEENTDKTTEQQIKKVTEMRNNHYEKWGKERGEEKPKEAELSLIKLNNKNITKDNYVCYICCQNKLVKGN